MLDELHVKNIALIEDATLEFSEGLTVLTGETGAGKTALLAALKLICGARADASFVRDGADEALAEARIFDGEEHVVKRRLSAAGRSKCSIDGAMASVGELAEVSSSIEVHGQHEQVLLLDPARQLDYLDSWAQDAGELERYSAARKEYLEAKTDLDALEQSRDKDEQELEFMRFTCEQIEKVNPQEGEYEQLEEELPRLQHADQLAQAVQTAVGSLHDDGAALDLIAQASAALSRQRGIDPTLDEMILAIDESLRGLEDLSRDLSSYAQTIETDPYRLEETLSRLDKLSGLMKRYGPGMDQVFATWERAKASIAASDGSPERLREAQQRMDQAKVSYEEAAQALSKTRHDAACGFCEELSGEVAALAMEGAGFEFSFEPLSFDRWGEMGSETIELLYRPAKTASAKPLRRIASGGELSRILLALECMHYETSGSGDTYATIVFDEVDSGIGGATANAVARKLDALSKSAQVIVVTHLAQVAALASEHYVVVKQDEGSELPHTVVVPVSGEERVGEIARMLSGDMGSVALEHARSLLAGSEVRA